MKIHPTAIVHASAEIADDVSIGPYCVIQENVKIGPQTILHSHVVVGKNTILGRGNEIYPGTILGESPQDVNWQGEFSRVIIGDFNVIREYVTIHRGSGGGDTVIGSENYLMAYVHAGHNVKIGNRCVFCNLSQLAGYAEVEDKVVIGGMAGVHQFVRIGTMAMVGGCSKNVKDIPPYVKADGSPSRVYGLNLVALKRNEIPPERREQLKRAYNFVYRSKLNLSQAIAKIKNTVDSTPEVLHFVDFLNRSSRQGILSLEDEKVAVGTFSL